MNKHGVVAGYKLSDIAEQLDLLKSVVLENYHPRWVSKHFTEKKFQHMGWYLRNVLFSFFPTMSTAHSPDLAPSDLLFVWVPQMTFIYVPHRRRCCCRAGKVTALTWRHVFLLVFDGMGLFYRSCTDRTSAYIPIVTTCLSIKVVLMTYAQYWLVT